MNISFLLVFNLVYFAFRIFSYIAKGFRTAIKFIFSSVSSLIFFLFLGTLFFAVSSIFKFSTFISYVFITMLFLLILFSLAKLNTKWVFNFKFEWLLSTILIACPIAVNVVFFNVEPNNAIIAVTYITNVVYSIVLPMHFSLIGIKSNSLEKSVNALFSKFNILFFNDLTKNRKISELEEKIEFLVKEINELKNRNT